MGETEGREERKDLKYFSDLKTEYFADKLCLLIRYKEDPGARPGGSGLYPSLQSQEVGAE